MPFDGLDTASTHPVSAAYLFTCLVMACFFGIVVAVSYQYHRRPVVVPNTFPLTLVLLSILIAIVMHVIDDRVARAFSLVGALSIVRFRTVLDDTQDIAFVIFAVVVGMAAGTGAYLVAGLGSFVVIATLIAFRFAERSRGLGPTMPTGGMVEAKVSLRTPIEGEFKTKLQAVLDQFAVKVALEKVESVRGGAGIEWRYRVRFRADRLPADFIYEATRIEGIQNVEVDIVEQREREGS